MASSLRKILFFVLVFVLASATGVRAQYGSPTPTPRAVASPYPSRTQSATPGAYPTATVRPLTPEERQRQQEEAERACKVCGGGCGGGLLMMIVLAVTLLALNIALLIWVARDAKSRGMDSSVLWMFLVMFTGPIGLIIYFFSRPQGQLVRCPQCGGQRLQASAVCPHCRNS